MKTDKNHLQETGKLRNNSLFLWRWIVLLCVIITILFFPYNPLPSDVTFFTIRFSNIDKLFHFTSYFSATLILCLVLSRKRKYCLLYAVVLVITAFGTELAQYHIPNRTGSIGDIIANITGIIAGIIMTIILRKRFS